MSEGQPIEYAPALHAAREFVSLIAGACERIEVAGSIRRGRRWVHDIEIVAMPKFSTIEVPDGLFGSKPMPVSALALLLEDLLTRGTLTRELPDGRKGVNGPKFKQFGIGVFKVDLFIVTPPAQWGTILLIRTGPDEFNKTLVRSIHDGGCCPMGMRFEEGQLLDRGQPVPTPEEEDVFGALGLAYVPPSHRDDWAKARGRATDGHRAYQAY